MVGRSPVAFLHLDVPPEEVDVNVHPTKVEVRFRDGQRIYSQLLATLRQAFLASDLHSRLQAPRDPAEAVDVPALQNPPPFAMEARPAERQNVADWFPPANSTTPSFQTFPAPGYAGGPVDRSWDRGGLGSIGNPRYGPPADEAPPDRSLTTNVDFDEFAPPSADVAAPSAAPTPAQSAPPPDPSPRSFDVRDLPTKALQVHDSYLVAETADGMVVIDQHALHERILFEELRMRIDRGGVESQRLLVAEPVDLAPAEVAAVLERRDALASLGMIVEPGEGDSILVASVPAMLPGIPPEQLLRDLADHFGSQPLPPTRDAVLQDVLAMIACKAAVKANQKLEPEEITALLERRHLVSDAHHCPHGRPTALVFTKSELERQFGRI